VRGGTAHQQVLLNLVGADPAQQGDEVGAPARAGVCVGWVGGWGWVGLGGQSKVRPALLSKLAGRSGGLAQQLRPCCQPRPLPSHPAHQSYQVKFLVSNLRLKEREGGRQHYLTGCQGLPRASRVHGRSWRMRSAVPKASEGGRLTFRSWT
jgi:hypothetical protein